MSEFWEPLVQLFTQLGILIVLAFQLLKSWSLLIVWVSWWLWGVNWKKTWPVLAQGAWIAVVLLGFISGLVWSRLVPSSCMLLGYFEISDPWWQLAAVASLIGLALFCGWLQGAMNWTPAEIDLEPPAKAAHGHAHH